jgi:hypothetical protein
MESGQKVPSFLSQYIPGGGQGQQLDYGMQNGDQGQQVTAATNGGGWGPGTTPSTVQTSTVSGGGWGSGIAPPPTSGMAHVAPSSVQANVQQQPAASGGGWGSGIVPPPAQTSPIGSFFAHNFTSKVLFSCSFCWKSWQWIR